jgi:hypothetical protein
MALADPASWSDLLRRTLTRYEEKLLRLVATHLIKPRNQWPVADLIDRILDTAANPAVLDRRLKDLEPACRKVLALIGHSRQPCWAFGNLVELVIALGHSDGVKPLLSLLECGLLYPLLTPLSPSDDNDLPAPPSINTFEQWLGFAARSGLTVFTLPLIASRAIGADLGLPDLSPGHTGASGPGTQPSHEADGLEWPLRLGALWQQVAAAPLRRTTQGTFFKRDLERLEQDSLLNAAPADRLIDVPDIGLLTVALAEVEGVVCPGDGELRAGQLPAAWDRGLAATLESLWATLPRLQNWNPQHGWRGGDVLTGNPFPSACLLACVLLARTPQGTWLRPGDLEQWITEHHPYWNGDSVRPSKRNAWVAPFLLGVAFHLGVVQAAKDEAGDWLVRLSHTGRWLLGLADSSPREPAYAQTLLVQPNLEIVAYRQGLTTGLIGKLTHLARWKNLGPACTLQLEPQTVYRALESGQTFDSIRLTLEQHGSRALPTAVLESLRTWSNKRDRLTVYPAATLLEFASPDDLHEALARGLPAVRIADKLAVVVNEDEIDYRHFRLTGTRDYALPPDRCVTVEPDGVTLAVDVAKSDLLLETELPCFAELSGQPTTNGRRHYRLTPASLANGRAAGWNLSALEGWFQQRAGQPLSPAARLLMVGSQVDAPFFRRYLVLHLPTPELADGVLQWPETRSLVATRLGPTALVVPEEHAGLLREKLQHAGIHVSDGPFQG